MHLVINCSGNEMKLTLWGARAREFEAEQVYAAGETGAVIAIFVGVLPKMLQGCYILVPCSISFASFVSCFYILADPIFIHSVF
jgi:hypothetical protein